jgi:putative inorganic carbon (hco3(-)) transporter
LPRLTGADSEKIGKMVSLTVIAALISLFIIAFAIGPVYGIAFVTAFRNLSLLTSVPIGKYEYSGEGFLTLAVIMVGCIFVLMNMQRLKNVTKWPFIFFILFCGLTFFVAEDTANFAKKLSRLIGYFFLYLMVVSFCEKDKNRKILSYALVLSLLVTNIPAVYIYFVAPEKYMNQLLGVKGGLREIGFMAKNNFGFFSCYMLLFLLYFYYVVRSNTLRTFFLALVLMQAALLVMSFTRAAWASFVAALPLMVLFSKNRIRFAMPFLVIAFIAASLYSVIYLGAYREITEKKEYGFSSWHFRTDYAWPASIKAFEKKPLVGWGLGNNLHALTKAAKLKATSHNDYLLVLVETGLIGLSLYLWLLTSLLFKTIRGIREAENLQSQMLCVAALGIFVAYLIGSLAEHLLQTPGATGSVITILGMAHGTLLAVDNKPDMSKEEGMTDKYEI